MTPPCTCGAWRRCSCSGVAHLYLVWWGDILSHYALVGTAAFLFTWAGTRMLLAWSLLFLILSLVYVSGGYGVLLASAARDTPDAIATWNGFATSFGVPPAADIAAETTAMRGTWADQFAWRRVHAHSPFSFVWEIGPQTLSAMLLGMAAYRSGMF